MIAYIDLGTGSYLFMLLIGGLVGAVYWFKESLRRFWYTITGRRSRYAPGRKPQVGTSADRSRTGAASATSGAPGSRSADRG
jgi:hypothetical protein